MKNNTRLQARLRQAGRRLVLIGSTGALFWGLALAVILLIVAAWLDLVWELSPAARTVLPWCAAAAGGLLLAIQTYRAVRSAGPAALARRLDRAVNSSGEILTGWELDRALTTHFDPHVASRSLTAGLVALAAEQAESIARRAPLAKAVPAKPLLRAAIVLAALAAAIGLLAWAMPGLVATEWDRFRQPNADVPPYSSLRFTVKPGTTNVLYGDDLEITATVDGGAVDHLELVLAGSGGESSLPMFSENSGTWRAVFSRLTEPAVYFVRSYRARSEKYNIEIITVPRIESVRVRVVPPEYAGQPSYEGPVPDDGVKGLRGARVSLWATSNRPLSGGSLVVTHVRGAKPAQTVSRAELTMRPSDPDSQGPGGQEAVGEFEIQDDGNFELRVIDSAGQASQQSLAGNVTLIKDQHPLVRIVRPPKESLATPTAVLPVVVSAEDDCGISRLELYRSLNSSRPLPAAVRLTGKAPHHRDEEFRLRLAGYGLEAGDELTFFARVEDNDPAGAKGAESPVVKVKIITQEEFERMLQMRQGMETLASKFRQAQRRLEGLAKEVEGLRKKLEKAPPGSPVAEEARKELGRLQQLMRREADELRKSAQHHLPFDIDKNLSPEIEKAAEMTEQMAAELAKLEKLKGLSSGELEKKLAELAKKLQSERRDYASSPMAPIELLEAVFPLIVDQERFVLLVQRQEDLAQRMASLKGHDNEDDPALKTRMRDLEREQKNIRTELDSLLGDIEDHATRLPELPELQKLRETALKFVQDVRGSGADEALEASESALSDFAGSRAYEKAKEAADILNQFVARCQGDGDMCKECNGALKFQPKLSQCMGNSLQQMLAAMGLGASAGAGNMPGSGAGSGMMGLYGEMPGMAGGSGSGDFGDPHAGAQGSGKEVGESPSGGGNPDAGVPGEADEDGTAAAASEAGVPLRYRKAVRQYFQRLSEELGDRVPAGKPGERRQP
jgi:hypothetical protein